MNKWQKYYCDTYYNGKIPRSKTGKEDMELLEGIKEHVSVEFPACGDRAARTETLLVTENECNIPNGKISVTVLASNLRLWKARGYKVSTF